MNLVSLLGVAGLVRATFAGSISYSGLSVNTKNGTYGGRHLPTYRQDVFLGIRYAQVGILCCYFSGKAQLLIFCRK